MKEPLAGARLVEIGAPPSDFDYAGCFGVIRHIGNPDQENSNWPLSVPFGQNLGGDDVFEGWQYLPAED